MAFPDTSSDVDSAQVPGAPSTGGEPDALSPDRDTLVENAIPAIRASLPPPPSAALSEPLTLASGEDRLNHALEQVTQTEVNLGVLLRGLKQFAQGASAARTANSELMQELERLRLHLAQSQVDEQVLRLRASQLEQLLNLVRHESERERQFLIEQQDAFLVEILSDHERQQDGLRAELHRARRELAGYASQSSDETDPSRDP